MNWQQGNWSGSINTTFTAAKDDLSDPDNGTLFRAPGYGLLDLFAQYEFSASLRISAALYNVTDRRYWYWSAVNNTLQDDPMLGLLSAPGRQISLQLSAHW
jgi:hemoglobin/transferrin/lactoferrin receptor protein